MHTRRDMVRLGAAALLGGLLGPVLVGEAPAEARRTGYPQPRRWGTAMPGIVTAFPARGRQIALTFDACAGGYDRALIAVLRRHRIPAVLFLNAHWIDAHPRETRALARDPLFTIGNHGTRHVPLSVTGRSAYGIAGTASPAGAATEVSRNHTKIARLTGRAPRWFRTGTAHYDDVAVRIVAEHGETPVGFTVNADAGGTESVAGVEAKLRAARPGSIVLAHMNRPGSGTAAALAVILPRMRAAGWEFVSLDRVVGDRGPIPELGSSDG
ncbi:MAG: polysaccharide deacetylase family protein [Gordonia sp. (in: high G+C Gram-positive bacteria)]|uniref:polysaccharide deacetylase family protein n=1 Tax=Gordonia sp. (in: high G+C Gram-positive bacteria) TaxID=84139 RepID=UPI0039E52E9A